MQNEITPRSGVHYFFAGWRLIMLPGIKRYVLLPLLINIVLLGGAFWWLYRQFSVWIPYLMGHMPHWLCWFNYLLWPLCVLAVLIAFSYFFSTVANLIAAPFSGLLAERLESRLIGHIAQNSSLVALMRDTPRMLRREFVKLCYYLSRALVLLILHFIPPLGQTLVPALWFLFSAWMLAIQYCDYPFDNHKVPFPAMRAALRRHKVANLQFGAMVSLFTLIPVVNLVILPVAVCGATAMWINNHRADHTLSGS
ncbi:MAG: Sulfate transporter CysZ [Sodalis sp.]|uniref:sulfate transporter CysZ n=1 Tax=Sodalis sp. (in: enterobacteria) TaxID=1898979 RepID=UPI003872F68D|nr:MAG: Sulfate transporter CysZ [Sodalis sp.]